MVYYTAREEMMTAEILMVGPMMSRVREALEREFTLHRLWEAEDRAALLAQVAGQGRGIATAHGADAALIDALPKLEIISNFGVGYDAVDVARAKTRDIIVTNTPHVLNDDVADLAIALMLNVSRQLVLADRYVREGAWQRGPMPLTRCVGGKTVGVLGLGRIGRAFAGRAEAMNCRVVYHNRRPRDDISYPYLDSPVALAEASDFLVVITPGGADTTKLVDRRVLDALGPQGILINVARGSVVDEAALVAALREGSLGGAGLDVFADEPHVPEALLGMDNVVLLPHVGSATLETRAAMGDLVVDNLRAHFAGKPALTPVY